MCIIIMCKQALEVTNPYNSKGKQAEELALAIITYKVYCTGHATFLWVAESKGYKEMLQMFDPK